MDDNIKDMNKQQPLTFYTYSYIFCGRVAGDASQKQTNHVIVTELLQSDDKYVSIVKMKVDLTFIIGWAR